MSTKSLVSAKVLGGGIAGASGVVGTGYGITRYLKSEEADISQSAEETTTGTTEGTHVDSPSRESVEERRGTVEQHDTIQPSPSNDALSNEQQVQSGSGNSSGVTGEPLNTVTGESQVTTLEGGTNAADQVSGKSQDSRESGSDGQQSPSFDRSLEGQVQAVLESSSISGEQPSNPASNQGATK